MDSNSKHSVHTLLLALVRSTKGNGPAGAALCWKNSLVCTQSAQCEERMQQSMVPSSSSIPKARHERLHGFKALQPDASRLSSLLFSRVEMCPCVSSRLCLARAAVRAQKQKAALCLSNEIESGPERQCFACVIALPCKIEPMQSSFVYEREFR